MKLELEKYKKEIEKYKTNDKERWNNYKEFYASISSQFSKLQEFSLSRILEITKNSDLNLSRVTPYLEFSLKDRYKAIDTMIDAIIQYSLPVSHKYLIYVAENNGKLKNKLPEENITQLPWKGDLIKTVKEMEIFSYELMKEREIKHFLKSSALKFRKTVGKFIKYKQEIQNHLSNLDQFVFRKILPLLEPKMFMDFINWAFTVYSNPKFR